MATCDLGSGECVGHLVLGLGNPGARYEGTRHNVGFRVVDRVALRLSDPRPSPGLHGWAVGGTLGRHRVWLAKPLGYMNRSGLAAGEFASATGVPVAQLVVVHDDLDLPFGRLRIRTGGGHGGHNGVRSVAEVLGTAAFGRLKVGIGRPEVRGSEAEYVLAPFAPAEEGGLPSLLDRAVAAVATMILEGAAKAMSCLNPQPAHTGGTHGKHD